MRLVGRWQGRLKIRSSNVICHNAQSCEEFGEVERGFGAVLGVQQDVRFSWQRVLAEDCYLMRDRSRAVGRQTWRIVQPAAEKNGALTPAQIDSILCGDRPGCPPGQNDEVHENESCGAKRLPPAWTQCKRNVRTMWPAGGVMAGVGLVGSWRSALYLNVLGSGGRMVTDGTDDA